MIQQLGKFVYLGLWEALRYLINKTKIKNDVACQYTTNFFDKESIVFCVLQRAKKYHFQQNLLLLMVIGLACFVIKFYTSLKITSYLLPAHQVWSESANLANVDNFAWFSPRSGVNLTHYIGQAGLEQSLPKQTIQNSNMRFWFEPGFNAYLNFNLPNIFIRTLYIENGSMVWLLHPVHKSVSWHSQIMVVWMLIVCCYFVTVSMFGNISDLTAWVWKIWHV